MEAETTIDDEAASVAELISTHTRASGKTQAQIARECGFRNGNIIAMFGSGATKVPLARVPALSESLGISEFRLFMAVMKEDRREELALIERLFVRRCTGKM